MRILQVITDTDRRGAQVFAIDLGAALEERGHDVRTVALAPGSRVSKLDVAVLGIRSRGLGTLRLLRSEMKRVDVTIAHGSSTLLACGLAGLGPGRPFVYRQISDSRFWAPTWIRRARVAAYLRFPGRIVALSNGAADTLHEYLWVPARKVDVVPNGVPRRGFAPASPAQRAETRAALGLPEGSFVVTYTGALVPEKGVHVAIEALSDPDAHLLVVGGGPELERLRSLAAESAPGRIHFAGELVDVLPAYRASDAVILASLGGDSMPASLIEAGFCALPCVSTPVGSISDIVIDGRTGVLVEPGDVASTASAINSYSDDRGLGRQHGRAAEQHCLEHFEIGVVADVWLATLERVALRRT
jgi:glycosyltransferase involved in cell wall biosynthesis